MRFCVPLDMARCEGDQPGSPLGVGRRSAGFVLAEYLGQLELDLEQWFVGRGRGRKLVSLPRALCRL